MRALAGWLRLHWPPLVAALIAMLLLSEGLVPGRAFFYRDLGTQFWPVIAEARTGLGGSVDLLPFWSHASTNGRPLLANPGFSFLSPFTLAWAVLPHESAFDLFLLLHAMLAASGMAALARALGVTPQSSLLAGVALGLGGGVVSAHNLWWALVALGWAPWVLLAAIRAIEKATARRCALLALALALQADGGMPEVVLATLLVGALLTLARAEGPPLRRALRCAVTWGACGLWGIAIAAAQLLPGVLHARTTIRALGMKAQWVLYNSLDPRALPGIALPRWGGNPMHAQVPGAFPGAEWIESGTPYLVSTYCGAIVAVLAALAVVSWLARSLPPERRALVAGLTLAALLGVVLAMGRFVPPVKWAVEAAAPLPLRFPVKALFATFLSLPLLAALGLDDLLRRLRYSRIAHSLALAIALTAGLDLMLAHAGFTPTIAVSEVSEPPLAGMLKSRASGLGARDGEWFLHHERFPLGEWGPPPGTIPPTNEASHVWQRRMLMPPLGLAHGLRHSYDRVGDLLEDVRTVKAAGEIYASPRPEWARRLGEAGVLFVVSPTPDLQESTGGVLVLDGSLGPDAGVPQGSGFVHRNLAFRPWAEMVGPAPGSAAVESLELDHRGMTFRVRTQEEATLVVREALGDLATWRATLDGRPLPIRREQGIFAAVTVPPGAFTIRFDHVPPGWNLGLALSAAGSGAALLAIVLGGRLNHPPRSG